MINRTQAPKIQTIAQLSLPEPFLHHLDNGIPVYEIKLGAQEVIKLELVFQAGRWYEKDKLVARATSQLLKAGSKHHNAEEIANFFEYFGSKLSIYDGFNTVNIQVYCLSKHLPKLLPMLQELLQEPAFSDQELGKYIKRNQQSLKVQLQKNDVVAYRLFTEALFGEQHPYGYNSTEALYRQLNSKKLHEHFQQHYVAEQCTIFVAGKTSAGIISLFNQYFGQLPQLGQVQEPNWHLPQEQGNQRIHQDRAAHHLQVSIRVGRRTFPRQHADCDAFYMTNMVLGGYFGARLMQNLRERHGFTYGVYSSVETLRHSGYWYVHTDVGKDVKDAALGEIYHEIERLQKEHLSQQELEMVRNYTMGMQLTTVDGVFNVASIVKSLITAGLTPQHYQQFIRTIQTIDAEQIRLMAQRYLNKEDLTEVVIG